MGFVDLAGKVVGVKDHPNFGQLLPHLEMLNKTTVLQNASSTVTDDAANIPEESIEIPPGLTLAQAMKSKM